MTLIRDGDGRSILEGTVYVAIAFDGEGNILASKSSHREDIVAAWAKAFLKVQEDLKLPTPVIGYTIATYREML